MAVVESERDEEAILKGKLRRLGIAPDVQEGIKALAPMILNHAQFASIIMAASGDTRQALYDAVRPYLRFRPKPLDVYVAEAGRKAEAERLPTIEDGKLVAFKPAQDVGSADRVRAAMAEEMRKKTLVLKCNCGREESFHRAWDENSNDVILRARRAGWVCDFKSEVPREICPECNG